METLQNLVLKAVPHPAAMARKYLPPHHLLAVALEAIDYEEQRNKFHREHRHQFSYVLKEFWFLEIFFFCVFRQILECLFWMKDYYWLSVKSKVYTISLV